jgi:hypothetical protein
LLFGFSGLWRTLGRSDALALTGLLSAFSALPSKAGFEKQKKSTQTLFTWSDDIDNYSGN